MAASLTVSAADAGSGTPAIATRATIRAFRRTFANGIASLLHIALRHSRRRRELLRASLRPAAQCSPVLPAALRILLTVFGNQLLCLTAHQAGFTVPAFAPNREC